MNIAKAQPISAFCDSRIGEKSEYVFTEWDPTAASDLAALRSYFDTNGDGKPTAADKDCARFTVRPVVGILIRCLISCIFLAAVPSGSSAQTITRDHVELPDGRIVSRIVEGPARIAPFSTIIVCSDGAIDDIANLRKVADVIVPGETYTFLDGRDPSIDPAIEGVTLAYFGKLIEPSTPDDCVDRFPGFRSFVLEQVASMKQDLRLLEEQLSAMYKKKYEIAANELAKACGGSGYPKAKSDVVLSYAVGFRGGPNANCSGSYVSLFGFGCVCLGGDCRCRNGDAVPEEFLSGID